MGTIAKTDAQLVEASRRGELEAFGHLVERYQDVVCAVGYSATGDRVLGEDVAQDTFVAAWQQLDRIRDVMKLGPWLCGIARNLGRKARRRTHREQLGEPAEQPAPAPNAFEQLASRDAERVVRDALDRVPDSYREVLVLYYREERTVHDVAGALGISEEAVNQRLSRGRKYLADSVGDLVERSLRGTHTRRNLVAAVLAAIALFAIPSRVEASPATAKGSTMLKLALAATALTAAGTAAYLLHNHAGTSASGDSAARVAATTSLFHYGAGSVRAPSLGATAPRHSTPARRAAVDDLGWLPANADVVVGVDMTRIQTSVLWQMFVEPAVEHAAGIDDFVTACGFDPLASLTRVTIGVYGLGGDSETTGTIVVHGFDKTKVMACVAKYAVPDAGGPNVTIDDDVVLMANADPGRSIGLTWVDDTTALVVTGAAAATKASIQQVAAGHGALAASPAFTDLFADINSDDPLWLIVGPSSPVFGDINTALAPYTPIRVAALYGSMDVTSSLSVQAGVRLASPDQVTQLVGLIQTQIAQLTGSAASDALATYFDQVDVTSDGNDVIVDVSAGAAQLMQLATKAQVNATATPAGSDAPGTFSVGLGF